MLVRWGHKNENQIKLELLKDISDTNIEQEELKNLNIKIEIPKFEKVERKRDISLEEKFFKQLEKGAIWAVRLKLKWEKFCKKLDNIHELRHRLDELDDNNDREKFRRQITCVFSLKYLEEFITMMQALGFVELGGFEYLGRRDADYSMAMNLDEKYRLHARVFCVGDIGYVLVHHEPKADEDLSLHIKGYFDRIFNAIIKYDEKTGKGLSIKPDELKIEEGSDGIEKVELSNYEKGADIYLKMLKDRVPNFYKKINKKIDDTLIKMWREFLGAIDHLSPEQLLIENLWESSRYIPPFIQIRETGRKMFERLGFDTEPAWDINIPASNQYFIATYKDPKSNYKVLVFTKDLTEEILRPIGLLRTKYNPKYVIVISPDISIFGPTQDDIPPKNIEIPLFNPIIKNELIEFLKDSKVSIIPVSVMIDIFKMNLRTPITSYQFELIFNKFGLISKDDLIQVFQKEEQFRDFIAAAFNIINYFIEKNKTIEEKNKWISIKELEKMTKIKFPKFNSTKLIDILILMENPIVGLLESKKHEQKEFRLNPTLEEIDIVNKRKILEKLIQDYLIELKNKIIK